MLSAFLLALVKVVLYMGSIVGGVFVGKKLRDRKDRKATVSIK